VVVMAIDSIMVKVKRIAVMIKMAMQLRYRKCRQQIALKHFIITMQTRVKQARPKVMP